MKTMPSSNRPAPKGEPPRGSRTRYAVYGLLILAACASAAGRTMSVTSARGKTPFLSANDRSRMCAVRAIVDYGTWEIDEVIQRKMTQREYFRRTSNGRRLVIEGTERNSRAKPSTLNDYVLVRDPEWNTIDKVYHKGRDGEWHYYSSKPPLYLSILAAEYQLIKYVIDRRIDEEPFVIGRILILLNGMVPLGIMLTFLSFVIDRVARSDWTRYTAMTAACFGTFLSTFAVTINNHMPAAMSVAIALYAVMLISREESRAWFWFAIAGLFAAFAAANDLPALAFFALAGLACLIKDPLRTLLAGVPAAAVVVVAFFYVNYSAHDSLIPPYRHWRDGPAIVDKETGKPIRLKFSPSEMADPIDDWNPLFVTRLPDSEWTTDKFKTGGS
jgi:hypothetical protein